MTAQRDSSLEELLDRLCLAVHRRTLARCDADVAAHNAEQQAAHDDEQGAPARKADGVALHEHYLRLAARDRALVRRLDTEVEHLRRALRQRAGRPGRDSAR